MKFVVTAQGQTVDAAVDPRFGRAKYFLAFDSEDSLQPQVHSNAVNLEAAQGAGIQAARNVAALGAQVLITGHVGPKAFAALTAAGVKIMIAATGTVAQAIADYRAGKLQAADQADVAGHW